MTDTEPQDHELLAQLKRIRYDLTALQGKLTEALAMAGRAKLDTHTNTHVCPECKTAGITHDLRGTMKLSEHRYHSHNGPLPDHYAKAEQLATHE